MYFFPMLSYHSRLLCGLKALSRRSMVGQGVSCLPQMVTSALFIPFSLLQYLSLLSYLWGDSPTVLSALLFSCALASRHAQALPSHTPLACAAGRLKKKHNFIFYFKTVFSRRFLNLSDEVRGNLVRFVFEWQSSFMTSRGFLHDI